MGDTQLGQVMAPALTSIHFFYKTSGMEAARMMVDLLENEEAVTKEIRMGYELKIRQSTRSHSSSWDVPQGSQLRSGMLERICFAARRNTEGRFCGQFGQNKRGNFVKHSNLQSYLFLLY